MTLLDSNLAYYGAIFVVFVNFVLFLVATITNWQCVSGNTDMCFKLYDDTYQDDLFSGDDKNNFHGYRAALAFAILSTLAAFVQLGFIGLKMLAVQVGSSESRKLGYFIVALLGTIFSILQWSIFWGLLSKENRVDGFDFGPGFYLSIAGTILSLYPLIYASAVYFGSGYVESLGAKDTPTWKYSAVRRSAIAP